MNSGIHNEFGFGGCDSKKLVYSENKNLLWPYHTMVIVIVIVWSVAGWH